MQMKNMRGVFACIFVIAVASAAMNGQITAKVVVSTLLSLVLSFVFFESRAGDKFRALVSKNPKIAMLSMGWFFVFLHPFLVWLRMDVAEPPAFWLPIFCFQGVYMAKLGMLIKNKES
jgi:hypothetical protein